jgi:hypothetical protein
MKAKWRMCGAAATVLVLSSSAWAQDGLRSASLPERNLRSPDPSAPVDQFRIGPRFYSPFADPRVRDRQRPPRFPRGFFPFGSNVGPWAPYGPDALPADEQPYGYLQLQVMPATAEVLVDGYYVGSVDDVRRMGTGRALEPGPHRVELRAPGYENVTFDVRVVPDETIVYRRDLAANAPVLPPPVPGVPKTFYVIPGCYAGDRPPAAVRLPAKCDAANARTIPPQVSEVRVSGR